MQTILATAAEFRPMYVVLIVVFSHRQQEITMYNITRHLHYVQFGQD